MQHHDVVVIGGSAGSLEVLRELLGELPADLPAAVCAVIHVGASGPGLLPSILQRESRLLVAYAVDKEPFKCGRVYLAPPKLHLLIGPSGVSLSAGARENGFRPAIDPLFRSAAAHFGRRVIGIILSGAMDDGTAGLSAIKARCGMAVVQNPESAVVSSMPRSAVRNVAVDHVVDAHDLATLVARLVREPITGQLEQAMRRDVIHEPEIPRLLRCPDCGGPMQEVRDPNVLVFRCHEGHTYGAGTLFTKQGEQNRLCLRETISMLREQAALGLRVAARADVRGDANFGEFVRGTVDRLEQRLGELVGVLHDSEGDADLDTD